MPLRRRSAAARCARVALASLALVVGCGDGAAPERMPFSGTYALQSIDGQQQYIFAGSLGSVTRITYGRLVIRPDGLVTDVMRWHDFTTAGAPIGLEHWDSVEIRARRTGSTLLLDRSFRDATPDTLRVVEGGFLVARGSLRIHTFTTSPFPVQHEAVYVSVQGR